MKKQEDGESDLKRIQEADIQDRLKKECWNKMAKLDTKLVGVLRVKP